MSYHIVSPNQEKTQPVRSLSKLLKRWADRSENDDSKSCGFRFEVHRCLNDDEEMGSGKWGQGARLIFDMHPCGMNKEKKTVCPDRIWLCEPEVVYGYTYSRDDNSGSAAQSKVWTILMIRMLEVFFKTGVDNQYETEKEEAFQGLRERRGSKADKFFYEFLYYTRNKNGNWCSASPGPNNVAALYPEAMRYFLDVLNKDEELNAR